MQQCVRVLGFTDLRVEHILLLLCCYIIYHDEVGLEFGRQSQDSETIVGALLSELNDVSTRIEEYQVSLCLALHSRVTRLSLSDSTRCTRPIWMWEM